MLYCKQAPKCGRFGWLDVLWTSKTRVRQLRSERNVRKKERKKKKDRQRD